MSRARSLASLCLVSIPLVAFAAQPARAQGACAADLNRDGAVDALDSSELFAAWGKCDGCSADLDSSGVIDASDFAAMLEQWGPCPAKGGGDDDRYREHDDGTIVYQGRTFASWAEYVAAVGAETVMCGTRNDPVDRGGTANGEGGVAGGGLAGFDCDGFNTVLRPEYEATASSQLFCIEVVVHVIRNDSGTLGDISVGRIHEQIQILNSSFASARIRFRLAETDPLGQSTPGFVFYNNTSWYNAEVPFWQSIAWDTNRYLNIYTYATVFEGVGVQGFASLPWDYPPGDPNHAVHVRSAYFGVNPAAAPSGLGAVAVHEVGHFLGLLHTFERLVDEDRDGLADAFGEDGCGSGCCLSTGDLCCDTSRQRLSYDDDCAVPFASCLDGPDALANYMNYSHDACKTEFTGNQIARMRCTLLSRRALLPGACVVPGDVNGDDTVDGGDLAEVLSSWGPCIATPCRGDLSGDGVVDAQDIAFLTNAWVPITEVSRVTPGWATLIEAEPDPAIVTDPNLRNAILLTGLAWRVSDNLTGIEMVLIPPGTFMMGCSPSTLFTCAPEESPVHQVKLTCPFYMARTEVTQSQWMSIMGLNPSFFTAANGFPGSNGRPVERVSWDDISGLGGFLERTSMRLPTEAEWEYAYRAGTTTAFHGFSGQPAGTNNDALASSIAWFDTCVVADCGPSPVGQKLPNGFGLHDMAGNVWEWVSDWFDNNGNTYPDYPVTNPLGPATGTSRVLRGGAWPDDWTYFLRASQRNADFPNRRKNEYGFRVVRNP
jgi:formylglycine-generating enzyme required for sulfatase activity